MSLRRFPSSLKHQCFSDGRVSEPPEACRAEGDLPCILKAPSDVIWIGCSTYLEKN